MGLSGASLNRFRQKVDTVLDDALPVTLIIGPVTVTGSGPGGKTVDDYLDGGKSPTFRFPFRIPKSSLPTPPAVGDMLEWLLSEANVIPLEVAEIALRPHEDRYSMVCKPRRV